MITQFNVHEAKTHLSRLLKRVMEGEEIIIARAGKPIARMTAISTPPSQRQPGSAAGRIVIHADFDQPLPEFETL